jgi:hypothetical protein
LSRVNGSPQAGGTQGSWRAAVRRGEDEPRACAPPAGSAVGGGGESGVTLSAWRRDLKTFRVVDLRRDPIGLRPERRPPERLVSNASCRYRDNTVSASTNTQSVGTLIALARASRRASGGLSSSRVHERRIVP